MLSSQELYEVDQAARDELAGLFSSAIRNRSTLSDEDLFRVSRCLIETSMALLNYWQSLENGNDRAIIGEAKLMAKGYLAAYLD